MNITLAAKVYIKKMIDDAGEGMKMLLMDNETVSYSTSMSNPATRTLATS